MFLWECERNIINGVVSWTGEPYSGDVSFSWIAKLLPLGLRFPCPQTTSMHDSICLCLTTVNAKSGIHTPCQFLLVQLRAAKAYTIQYFPRRLLRYYISPFTLYKLCTSFVQASCPKANKVKVKSCLLSHICVHADINYVSYTQPHIHVLLYNMVGYIADCNTLPDALSQFQQQY